MFFTQVVPDKSLQLNMKSGQR